MRPCLRVSVLHLTAFVFLIGPVFARTMFATSPDYIVTTTTGASIVPGTTDVGNHCDDCMTNNIPLPFPVSFYDQVFTTFDVSSDGHLTFTSADDTDYNFCLPHDIAYLIVPASYDLYTTDIGNGQGIFTSVSGSAPNRIFNIEWRAQQCCISGPPSYNFEVRLYEGQRRIDFIYGTMATGVNAIGVQRDTGSQFTLVSCSSLPAPGTQYTFTIPDTCVPPPPNMVAWWRGDGNADDSIGGHHGTVFGGVTFGSGEVDQAFDFAGTSGRVLVPNSPSLNPSSQITIDAWVRSTGAGFQGLVGKGRPAVDLAYDLGITGTQVQWRIPNITPFGLLQVNVPIADGQWHHLAATYDGATMAVYFDGQLAGSSSNTGAIPSSSGPLVLGAFLQSNGTYGFSLDGQLDEVEIFDRALSAQEITDIYIAGSAGKCKCTPPPDSMIGWWPGEDDGSDIQDGNTLVAGNGNGFGFATGEVGRAFTFDGSQFATAGTPSSLAITTQEVSIDGWINPSVSPSGFTLLFGHALSGGHDYALILDTDLTGVIKTADGDPGLEHFVHTGYNPPLNTWTHVALTYDGSTITVYANGVVVGAESKTGSISNSGGPFNIGGRVDCCLYTGAIDEVEVFDRTLSGSEIAAIFHAGSAGKCRPCTPPPSGMIDWWPGDGNANDIQGSHNGTFQGNAGISVGKVGSAFSFDGNGDYIDVGDVDLPGAFTIDAWINPDSLQASEGAIIVKPGTFTSYALSVSNTGRLQGYVSNGVQAVRYTTADGTIVTGGWQHVAMTYDVAAPAGARIRLYVNGANVATTPNSDNAVAPGNEASSANIGSDGGPEGFDGLIDEVELFNRVLSPSEVSGIYDAGSGGKCKPAVPVERHLINISSRAAVGTGDNVAIGGFIIHDDPSAPFHASSVGTLKRVLIRGLGPSLNVNGTPVAGRLSDTVLELYNSAHDIITTNDDWGDAINAIDITASGLAPTDSHESAILVTLLSNSSYTAILRGKNDTTGIGLVEVYDLEPNGDSHLANISTRGQVLTGDDVLIGGIIVQGGIPVRVIVRALGPSLTALGVANALADPILELHDGNGALIATNDDWTGSPDVGAITATGLGPTNAKESAILFVPAPGPYTAVVSGAGGTTGVGLVEAYRLGPP